MPSGKYPRTEQMKKIYSEARKRFLKDPIKFNLWKAKVIEGNKNNPGKFKKGNNNWLGRRHTDETKQKMSLAAIGRRPKNYIDGRSNNSTHRKVIKGKLYSHIIYCSQPDNFHRVPKGCIIHHIDLNPTNNNPNNLLIMTDKNHRLFHRDATRKILGRWDLLETLD